MPTPTTKAQSEACRLVPFEEMAREQLNPLLARQVVSGAKAMLSRVYLKKGCVVPPHSHESEQLSYIVEGALLFRIGADQREEITVHAGEVLVIPSNVVHSAVALEDTLDMDIFSPIRQD